MNDKRIYRQKKLVKKFSEVQQFNFNRDYTFNNMENKITLIVLL